MLIGTCRWKDVLEFHSRCARVSFILSVCLPACLSHYLAISISLFFGLTLSVSFSVPLRQSLSVCLRETDRQTNRYTDRLSRSMPVSVCLCPSHASLVF